MACRHWTMVVAPLLTQLLMLLNKFSNYILLIIAACSGAPPVIDGATLNGTFPDMTRTYTCGPDPIRQKFGTGDGTIRCLESGEWETTDFECFGWFNFDIIHSCFHVNRKISAFIKIALKLCVQYRNIFNSQMKLKLRTPCSVISDCQGFDRSSGFKRQYLLFFHHTVKRCPIIFDFM